MVGKPTNGHTPKEPYFDESSWVSGDFFDFPWPFKDKEFDFSLCMGTLEDVRDPLPLIQEIQRISKAGFISTPTRAAESCPCLPGRHALEGTGPGYQHHRWLVDIKEDELVFVHKTQTLSLYKEVQITDYIQHTMNFFWKDSFKFREEYVGSIQDVLEELRSFKTGHDQWAQNVRSGDIDLSRYNRWDSNLDSCPDFSFAVENLTPEQPRGHLARLRSTFKSIMER